MNNEEKIAKIKEERKEMLESVNKSLKENGSVVGNDAKDALLTVIDFDEKKVKKYEALINAQELIEELTLEIANTTDVEEIMEIRKKINSCINKIKAELKKRDIPEERMEEYQSKVSYLRKDIAKYIRFLKRENNIKELENSNKNYDNLSEEDQKLFKKNLKNEIRYNARYLSEPKEDKYEVVKTSFGDLKFPKKQETKNHDDSIKSLIAQINLPKAEEKKESSLEFIPRVSVPEVDDFSTAEEYLDNRINFYNQQYKIIPTYEYNYSFLGNIVKLIKNVPIYSENKKAALKMHRDSVLFYGGSDLRSYTAYIQKKNSIRQGLKSVFSRSYLLSDEGQCLNDHNRCIEWLMDYCDNNSLQINYQMKKAY